jgi:hypothetical protein
VEKGYPVKEISNGREYRVEGDGYHLERDMMWRGYPVEGDIQ